MCYKKAFIKFFVNSNLVINIEANNVFDDKAKSCTNVLYYFYSKAVIKVFQIINVPYLVCNKHVLIVCIAKVTDFGENSLTCYC